MNRIIVNTIGREKRFALMNDGVLEKIIIQQPKQQSLVGGIFFGTVEKVLPGMNAAFIDIGLEKNGFLHRDKLPAFLAKKEDKGISSYLHQGERLLVQVEKDSTGDKGPRLTGIIELNGHFTVYEPEGHYVSVSKRIADELVREKWKRFGNEVKQESEGFLFRTVCEEQTEDEVLAEIVSLREKYNTILRTSRTLKKPGLIVAKNSFADEIYREMVKIKSGKVIVDSLAMKQELASLNKNEELEILFHQEKTGIFSFYRVEHELQSALQRVVPLENGSYLVFDEAEALTIIDVNTGKFSGKSERKETVLKTNELAAKEIARQITLRDLAGIILIDFIDMESETDRDKVKKTVERFMRNDGHRTRVVGFTPLGILQLTRKKERVSIAEGLTVGCSVCDGSGRVLSPETVAFQLERELLEQRGRVEEAILIETTEEVRQIFAGEKQEELKRVEDIIGLEIFFLISGDEGRPYYQIRQIGTIETIKARLEN